MFLLLSKRDTLANAFRWSPFVPNGANNAKTKSTGIPSTESNNIGYSNLTNIPLTESTLLTLACGIAIPSPIPVGPKDSLSDKAENTSLWLRLYKTVACIEIS